MFTTSNITDNLNSTLNGLLIGYYSLESILKSSLEECLHNQPCLNLILNFIGQHSLNDNFTIFNLSLLSKISRK
ncbi:unnamed protein product [Rotaria sordida]|uniref:Uncharacterized protein n=1 Tax=Rotaria sordida TaxID=392033 RepID=A0A820EQ16_9BILA|nr:unnamed protein product [Rotaria sordida]CAF4252202.1 unnamed protein product [Rotaria sordida]